MTELKQAYDRAMAHNAMLREALDFYGKSWNYTDPFDGYQGGWRPSWQWAGGCEGGVKATEALNATEADVDAWLEQEMARRYINKFDILTNVISQQKQQLATVTNERDALREFVDLIAIHKNDAYCSRDLSGLGFDAFYLLERLRQSPPSE